MSKTMKFEEALKRLEEIVSQMESGESDLDKSLTLFEEGIKLVKFCSSKLEEAKKKVEVLVKKGDKYTVEDFNLEGGSSKRNTKEEDDFFK